MKLQRCLAGWLIIAVAGALLGCPGTKRKQPSTSPGGVKATPGNSTSANSTPTTIVAPPTKQVVLIYTGDTLSELQPINGTSPKAELTRYGGLPALTAELFSYEALITESTKQRIANNGGDPSQVKTDFDKGLLGEHPFMLLDYGGWERATDPEGSPYVKLQFKMYHDLHYTAVGCLLYDQLQPERWTDYDKLSPPASLLNSAGPERTGTAPTVKIVTRTMHGALWGVVAVPLPVTDQAAGPVIQQYVDQAAAALAQAGCKYGILLCKGGPKSLYQKLKTDKRFTVVIGVSPKELAEPPGFGKLRSDGPVMLPELTWGGQAFGTCHLIYPTDGDAPNQFNFELHQVVDDLKSPFPYRAQAADAIVERKNLVIADQATAHGAGKIAAP